MHNVAATLWQSPAAQCALRADGVDYSYGELAHSALSLATRLRAAGIVPGERVALLLGNCVEFFPAYYGILLSGAVLVALNPKLRAEELERLLADSGAVALIGAEALITPLLTRAPSVRHWWSVGRDSADSAEGALRPFAELTAPSATPLPELHAFDRVTAHDPAMLLYTSGTTGTPKAVVLSHGNITSNVFAAAEAYGLAADDRQLIYLPLYHSYAQFSGFGASHAAGACVVLQPEFDVERVLAALRDEGITTLYAVPSVYQLLTERIAGNAPTLRRCISSGSLLSRQVVEAWYAVCAVAIHSGFGMSEASLVCVNRDPLAQPGSVGTPIRAVAVRVVDDHREPLPAGELGEVQVRGPNVMTGYWQRPELSAEVLHDGWLASGDIGYLDPAGRLYIVDRLKDMIDVGGLKVYPFEVEEVLEAHPAVQAAGVYGVPHPLLGQQVRAAVVLQPGAVLEAQAIIAHCRAHLADFKSPVQLSFTEDLPRGPTGKLLRRELRAKAEAPSDTAVELGVAPALALLPGTAGELSGFTLASCARRAPAAGEVELQLLASGLNFRDLLIALGLYPEPPPLGAECAAQVVAVGAGVTVLAPGDTVIAYAPGALRRYLTLDAGLVAPLNGMSPTEAAGFPVAYLTAAVALEEVAALGAGERVLIHAAAGGVGQAAVQIAHALGAEVHATAHPDKWPLLRRLGVRHLYHSRNLDFAAEVRTATHGQGVDVVLNSLTGPGFIAASLDLLRTGGRFIELSKRDIWSPAQVAARRGDLDYRVWDLRELVEQAPAGVGARLVRLQRRVAAGELRPLPYQARPVTAIEQALRTLETAGFAGKQVLVWEDSAEACAPRVARAPGALRDELRALAGAARRRHLTAWLRAAVAARLELDDPERIALDLGLFEQGLESLTATDLVQALARELSLPLTTTLLFDHPAIQPLADHLLALLFPAQAPAVRGPGAVPSPTPEADDGLDALDGDDLAALLAAELSR